MRPVLLRIDSASFVEGMYTLPGDEEGRLGPAARPDNIWTSSSPWSESREVDVGALGEERAVVSLVYEKGG